MQYNHKLTVRFISDFDDYGQPNTTTDKQLRCCILDENITNAKGDVKRKNKYDMTFLVSTRSYSPYSELFDDNMIQIIRNNRNYEIKLIRQINGFSGKPKYYQIFLNQVHK
jgi:hypothetical protein